MPNSGVTFDAVKARAQIDRAAKRLYANAEGVLLTAKPVLHDRMVALAPRRSGALIEHIYVEVGRGRNGPVLKAGVRGLPYPVFVEFGTKYAPAQPFLRPALAEMPGYIKRSGRR